MNEKNEYLSIAEFAEIVGISRQAVYNKLDNLTNYVKIIDKKKKIKRAAIAEFNKVEDNSVNQLDNLQISLQNQNESLQKQVDKLQQQIIEKDSRIADLTNQIIHCQVELQNLTNEALKIASQQQQLQAMQVQQKQNIFKRLFGKK